MNDRDPDQLSSWQFELPAALIASRPAAARDDSRLMVVDRPRQTITHSSIRQLPEWLRPGDLLVFNNTRVLPARLFGVRTSTGGRWEGLYLEETAPGRWTLLCETRGRLVPGETITVLPACQDSAPQGQAKPIGDPSKSLMLTLLEKREDGVWLASHSDSRSSLTILDAFGSLPLPPYLGRKLADADDQLRYQTQFAAVPGAVAAPTAGLHFTDHLLQRCRDQGIGSTELTLHVGPGTFRPITAARLSEHNMHEEWCRLTESACQAITAARNRGGRIAAVGTTSVRTLESVARLSGLPLTPWEGRTRLFIRPGHHFQTIDCLLTNFHLPGSTLLVLVAALAGYEFIMDAYREAVANRYRFYSYGDAMLIL